VPLTYCLNVHPGETWPENFAALRGPVLAVRDLVSPGRPFGPGLRLSAAAAATLLSGHLEELAAFLRSENLFVFTINGFPFGRFHGGPVKENVYAPDWRSPLRRDYTNHLATILAALLPEGETGSISTVPCSWKAWIQSPADIAAMLDHLTDCAAHCAAIASGPRPREILLALEPEPGCLLETTSETIAFFNGQLFAEGARLLAAKLRSGEESARALIRRHIGVCLDTCHAALQFEDPAESLRQYAAEGICVPKIQISSALRGDASPAALEALRPFDEPVYLHQVKARTAAADILGWSDLPQALAEIPGSDARELRVHFHVPLHFAGGGVLGSTASLLTPEFLSSIRRDPRTHLEIETYTWDILPAALRSTSIEAGIAAEFRWIEGRAMAAD